MVDGIGVEPESLEIWGKIHLKIDPVFCSPWLHELHYFPGGFIGIWQAKVEVGVFGIVEKIHGQVFDFLKIEPNRLPTLLYVILVI